MRCEIPIRFAFTMASAYPLHQPSQIYLKSMGGRRFRSTRCCFWIHSLFIVQFKNKKKLRNAIQMQNYYLGTRIIIILIIQSLFSSTTVFLSLSLCFQLKLPWVVYMPDYKWESLAFVINLVMQVNRVKWATNGQEPIHAWCVCMLRYLPDRRKSITQ